MIRKHIYKWHRICSLLIAIPVLCWAVSGFMHPLMTTIKPKVATQTLQAVTIDSSILRYNLPAALSLNQIEKAHNIRLIHIDTNWFYQVQVKNGSVPEYLSTANGKALRNGDKLYAQYLAKQFLEGQKIARPGKHDQVTPSGITNSPDHSENAVSSSSVASPSAATESTDHDCCDAAASCVLTDTSGSLVNTVEPINSFDNEYKYINRLLPVYKVRFDRADNIRVYVETTQDRFAFAMDDRRAAFDSFFAFFHTWEWLSGAGKFRHFAVGIVCSLALFSSLMGLYIFFISSSKRGKLPIVKARRLHRFTALTASLFTLMFTFSGALHALDKLRNTAPIADKQHIDAPKDKLVLDLRKIQNHPGIETITGISLSQIDNNLYWRVLANRKEIHYFNISDYRHLENGEQQHAVYLATSFSNQPASRIQNIEPIKKFSGEYGFVNKRLPVWKLSYAGNGNPRYYVETSTGKCAAGFTNRDAFEGYSFALLHKHHFMDWAGKSARDISTMIAAGLQVIMVLFGLYLFYRWMRK